MSRILKETIRVLVSKVEGHDVTFQVLSHDGGDTEDGCFYTSLGYFKEEVSFGDELILRVYCDESSAFPKFWECEVVSTDTDLSKWNDLMIEAREQYKIYRDARKSGWRLRKHNVLSKLEKEAK